MPKLCGPAGIGSEEEFERKQFSGDAPRTRPVKLALTAEAPVIRYNKYLLIRRLPGKFRMGCAKNMFAQAVVVGQK